MIHKRMMVLSVLACLSLSVMCAEPPISPWQALNPPMADPSHLEVYKAQEEFSDTPYEVTYPEAQYQNDTDYPLEEELLTAKLPFKMPFKMNKKQMAVVMKLLKVAIKPVLKSKSVRDVVAYIDESLITYTTDLETQMYVTLLLDSMQEIYEGKETSELNMMFKRFFVDVSDEETARAMTSFWSKYVSPIFTRYLSNPMREYFFTPVSSYMNGVIDDYSNVAKRIGTLIDGSQTPYLDISYPDNYQRWSETMNSYTNRISNWASDARQGLTMARRMLELQDEARSCGDCDHSSPDHDDTYTSVQ